MKHMNVIWQVIIEILHADNLNGLNPIWSHFGQQAQGGEAFSLQDKINWINKELLNKQWY